MSSSTIFQFLPFQIPDQLAKLFTTAQESINIPQFHKMWIIQGTDYSFVHWEDFPPLLSFEALLKWFCGMAAIHLWLAPR